jgi:hypothetical protein
MAPECQEKNLKGLNMVAIGVNKSAEQYLLLDDQTRDDLASGKFADQRRGSYGTSVPSSAPSGLTPAASAPTSTPAVTKNSPTPAVTKNSPATTTPAATAVRPSRPKPVPSAQPTRRRPAPPRPAAVTRTPRPWTKSQERLALLYNEQGLRPDEIAQRLRLTPYTVTQIILSSRNRGKL